MIPYYRPYYGWAELLAVLRAGVRRSEFELALAARVGARYGVAFAYGRSGVVATMKALKLSAAEVILPAYTCVVMPKAIVTSGNRPVFVDINLDDYTMDVEACKRAFTSQTRVIVPTHLYGYPADVDGIRTAVGDKNIIIFEDCAQGLPFYSQGVAKLQGDIGLFSFGPGKLLCTVQGGVVVTNSAEFYEKIKTYRDKEMNQPSANALAKRWVWFLASYLVFRQPVYALRHRNRHRLKSIVNTRPAFDPSPKALPSDVTTAYTNFQARIGLVQLRKLDEMLAKCRAVAKLYHQELEGVKGVVQPPLVEEAAYSFYTLRVPRRDESSFRQCMFSHNVSVDQSYDYALPNLKSYRSFVRGAYPCATQAAQEVINLPCYPHLQETQVRYITTSVRDCVREIDMV